MLAAKNGVSRRLWSPPSRCRAAAASSKLTLRPAMNFMDSAVGWAMTLLVV
jgi:hypothetical protein